MFFFLQEIVNELNVWETEEKLASIYNLIPIQNPRTDGIQRSWKAKMLKFRSDVNVSTWGGKKITFLGDFLEQEREDGYIVSIITEKWPREAISEYLEWTVNGHRILGFRFLASTKVVQTWQRPEESLNENYQQGWLLIKKNICHCIYLISWGSFLAFRRKFLFNSPKIGLPWTGSWGLRTGDLA